MVYAGSQHSGQFQRLRVHIEDMAGGVEHADRALGRYLVEVVPVRPPAAIVDRVQRPAGERRGRVIQLVGGLAQPLDRGVDGLEAGPDRAFGVHAVEEAAIDIGPERAFHDMAVAFDQTRHQHLAGEALVQPVVAPAGQLVERAGAENAAVAHRHMGGVRPGRVHGDDLAGGIDGGGHASGSPGTMKPGPAARRFRVGPVTRLRSGSAGPACRRRPPAPRSRPAGGCRSGVRPSRRDSRECPTSGRCCAPSPRKARCR